MFFSRNAANNKLVTVIGQKSTLTGQALGQSLIDGDMYVNF